mgnify:CR=1 FL=1
MGDTLRLLEPGFMKKEGHTPSTSYQVNDKDASYKDSLDPLSASSKRTIQSFHVCVAIVFLLNVGTSMIIPAQWPRMLLLDATPSYLGLSIALFSFGQMMGSNLFCYIFAEQSKYFRVSLIISFVLIFLGDLGYFLGDRLWIVFVARAVSGFGFGNQEAIQDYVEKCARVERRADDVGKLSLFATISLVIGPLLTACLSAIPDDTEYGGIYMNVATLPGLISALFALSCVFILVRYDLNEPREEEDPDTQIMMFDTAPDAPKLVPGTSILAVLVVVYFVVFMNSSIFETVVVPYTMSCYDWPVLYNCFFFASMGVVSAAAFFALQHAGQYLTDLSITIPSLYILTLGYLLVFPFTWEGDECFVDSGAFFTGNYGHNQHVLLWRFLIGTVVIAFTYPSSFTGLVGMYAKVLFWMDPEVVSKRIFILKSAGYLSRILGPLWTSLTLEYQGSITVFMIIGVLTLMCAISMSALRAKLDRLLQSFFQRNLSYSYSGLVE